MKLKLAILPLCLITLSVFGFDGTISQSIKNYNGSGKDVGMTWYIGAHSCRVDLVTNGPDVSAVNTVLLFDAGTKTMRTYTIGAAGDKVYYEINASAITADIPAISVNKTTETKKIQGYNCEKWVVITSTATYDAWITRDIDFDAAAYKDFFKSSMEIQALAKEGVKGFPILTESNNGANAVTTDKVVKQALPATTFSVPAEYKQFIPGSQSVKPATGK